MSDQLRALQIRFQDYLTGDSEAIEQDIVSTEDALAELVEHRGLSPA